MIMANGSTMADIAWAAGLFEGEGCITHGSYGGSKARTPVLALQMTDEDVVRKFASTLGFGCLTGPLRNGEHKPTWRWNAQGLRDVQAALALFWNFLGARRRERAAEILREARERGIAYARRAVCKQGHQYSGDNLYVTKQGFRQCKSCSRARQNARRVNARQGAS